MRKSKVTIRDVAKAAGVHISTASRALNSETQHLITADVVERVRSVARKLDYRANAFASGLRTKRSNAIGLLIPDLWNPAFPAIVAGVQEVVVREGYEITIASDENSSERHATVIESMLSRQVDGLILATAILKDHDLKVPDTHVEIAASYSRADGARAAHQLFAQNRRPTAIVVANDLLALGCYDALRSVRIRCPADISITGYNDMPFVDLVSPPLTTLMIEHHHMAIDAARFLLPKLAEPPSPVA